MVARRVSWDDVQSIETTLNTELDKDQLDSRRLVGVVGAGLVGSLAASFLAQKGYDVEVFEYRSDIREEEVVHGGRSINMTIAKRGLDALERIGVKNTILEESIPLYGRMIHKLDGSTYPVYYGVKDQAVYSISRALINKLLITKAEEHNNVRINFNHKLQDIDLKNTEAKFVKPDRTTVRKEFDAIFSCEGTYSKTRQQFLRDTSFSYSQLYIDALYIELSIEPDENGNSKMPALNYLHIWPRGHFMLIGLPNKDMSWTMTLFGPKSIYSEFQTASGVMGVFNKHFSDVIPHIEEKRILADCLGAKGYPMVSVKCSPHVLNNTILLGDAAHAMVPFYGEGMNCGFEDLLVLDSLLEQHDMGSALTLYSGRRTADTDAMCDLALYNYTVMRDLVTSPLFLIRKWIDHLLHAIVPELWVPLYTSIRFQRRMGYRDCLRNKQWQDRIIDRALLGCGVVILALLVILSFKSS